VPDVTERTGEVGGLLTHWREAPGSTQTPVLYLHGVPTASWDWEAHLQRIGGVAPDLPGFGRSAKPDSFDYSIDGYAEWLEAFVDTLGMERFALVVHDWGGGLGLGFAQRVPQRVARLVVHTCVPILPGYRWHWIARIWRRRLIGELFMSLSTKSGFRLMSRQSNVTPGPLPGWFIDRFWADFDSDTRRAILRLYRSAPEARLAEAGATLGDVRCPALILWPTDDPYVPVEFGERYAAALGGPTELEIVEGAGHWMWLDRPDVVDKAAAFLNDLDVT
jgi:pimeloyl-ACP methyl ester carboxylesterase